MKTEILKALDEKIAGFHLAIDIEYWKQFRQWVEEFNPEKKTIEQRAIDFYDELTQYLNQYPATMLREFYDYWTEHNANGRKMRFEMQKTWDTSRRLARWHKGNKKDDSGTFVPKTESYSK